METERTVTVIGRMGNNQKITPDVTAKAKIGRIRILRCFGRTVFVGPHWCCSFIMLGALGQNYALIMDREHLSSRGRIEQKHVKN